MRLRNPTKNLEVEIAEEAALSQISLYGASIPMMTSQGAAVESQRELTVECDGKVMETIRYYAMDFHATNRQIGSWSSLTDRDKETLERANAENWLISLYDTAFLIGFDRLKDLCAAFLSFKIDHIAMTSETPMTGAERIREFLHMKNDWTDEEMEHLRKEMELAVQADPRAY